MTILRERLGSSFPVVAAPMSGGPTTPALVLAAVEAGSGGSLAGGYKTAEELSDQVAEVRASTEWYGVNVFSPNPDAVDAAAYAAYRELLLPLAESYGVDLPATPIEDDDGWQDKVELLVEVAPPLVSFTFGLPDPLSLGRIRRTGALLVQTVTSPEEARMASERVMDALIVQSVDAGGHWGTFTPELPPERLRLPDLVRAVRAVTDLPIMAVGGIGASADVAAALEAGAEVVAVGTLLLLATEAGTNPAHRAGFDKDRGDPITTSAFSGRPAGGLRNDFLAAYDGHGPLGYPALHHLTSPIRKAAAAVANPEHVNLWAGTGHRNVEQRPTGEILRSLAP
ncbi:MAG TPA: nitronate monooxygenase [Nocardioides sp.]|nr:nitronate monooxygenase [Nocardioides sp.]